LDPEEEAYTNTQPTKSTKKKKKKKKKNQNPKEESNLPQKANRSPDATIIKKNCDAITRFSRHRNCHQTQFCRIRKRQGAVSSLPPCLEQARFKGRLIPTRNMPLLFLSHNVRRMFCPALTNSVGSPITARNPTWPGFGTRSTLYYIIYFLFIYLCVYFILFLCLFIWVPPELLRITKFFLKMSLFCGN
jgi:hypothetical protein